MLVSLYMRMIVLLAILFGVVYAIATIFMSALGISNIYFYIFFAAFVVGIQYLLGPKIVEWTMRVQYIKREDNPGLYAMIEELVMKAKIPMPRIGIAEVNVPNAFAFGRTLKDGRLCITRGLTDFLNKEELRAVIAHELTHLKNRDVLFITLLSVIPLVLYRIFFHIMFYSGYSRRRESGGYLVLVGLAAFILYLITNLLVLYASRIREYFADRGAIQLGNAPHTLATALYKLVYGAARVPREQINAVEGVKAFSLNDLSKAQKEIKELAQLDLDRSGTIDPYELKYLRDTTVKLSFTAKMMELLSTHPNMLKRIKQLSRYQRIYC